MLYTAGHTITVSGLTLTLCFLGLTMFKVQMLQTLGVGCATAILCTLLTAVTQTAVLLLLFPRFFAACVEPAHCCRRRIRVPCWANSSSSSSPKASQQSAEGSDPPATADSSTHTRIVTAKLATEAAPLLGNGAASDAAAADHDARTAAVAEHEARRLRGTCWFRLASRLVQCPFNIIAIVVVCGAVLPIALHAFGYPKSDSLSMLDRVGWQLWCRATAHINCVRGCVQIWTCHATRPPLQRLLKCPTSLGLVSWSLVRPSSPCLHPSAVHHTG